MEYAENINVIVVSHQVCDSVMLVKQDSDMSVGKVVTFTQLREPPQVLNALVNSVDRFESCIGIVRCDVLVDVFEPAFSFRCPGY